MTEQQKDNLVDMKFKGVKIAEDKLIQIDDSGLFDNYDEYMVNLDNINHNYHEFIGIDDLWEQGFKGENVRVAVLDTGASEHIEYDNVVSHKYFEGWEDYTDSDVKHGTHVLGIMAASNQNDKVVGIAPKSNYVSGKVMADYDKDHEKYHKISWDLKGLEYVIANDFKVVNMSYGGARLNERIEKIENSNKTDEEKQIEIDKLYQLFGDYNDIFQPAYFIANENLGIILIAAAGNDGYNKMEDTVDYPAAHENVIAVSNSFKKNSDGKIYLHPSSSKGPSVELTAPGTDILSTVPNNEYDRLTGTSMASPIVSGVATLLREKYPELSAQQIRKIMQLQALPVEGYILSSDGTKTNTIEKNYEFGYGLVQAETGMKINSKIYLGTPREGYYFPNNQEFKTGQMIEPGTYDVVRMNNDKTWFEIKIADKKYRWVNADIFDVSLGYQVTTYETENKFSKIDGEIVGTVSPRTYEVVQRNNEWFQIIKFL